MKYPRNKPARGGLFRLIVSVALVSAVFSFIRHQMPLPKHDGGILSETPPVLANILGNKLDPPSPASEEAYGEAAKPARVHARYSASRVSGEVEYFRDAHLLQRQEWSDNSQEQAAETTAGQDPEPITTPQTGTRQGK